MSESDIPEDIRARAQAIVDEIVLEDASAVPTIARALHVVVSAERERCAKIAEGVVFEGAKFDPIFHRHGIAAAIRRPD